MVGSIVVEKAIRIIHEICGRWKMHLWTAGLMIPRNHRTHDTHGCACHWNDTEYRTKHTLYSREASVQWCRTKAKKYIRLFIHWTWILREPVENLLLWLGDRWQKLNACSFLIHILQSLSPQLQNFPTAVDIGVSWLGYLWSHVWKPWDVKRKGAAYLKWRLMGFDRDGVVGFGFEIEPHRVWDNSISKIERACSLRRKIRSV